MIYYNIVFVIISNPYPVFARAIPSKALIGELVERLAVERVPRSSLSLPLALSTARALALEQPATDALVDALGLEPPPPVPVKYAR